jgi:hypothetical protein
MEEKRTKHAFQIQERQGKDKSIMTWRQQTASIKVGLFNTQPKKPTVCGQTETQKPKPEEGEQIGKKPPQKSKPEVSDSYDSENQ